MIRTEKYLGLAVAGLIAMGGSLQAQAGKAGGDPCAPVNGRIEVSASGGCNTITDALASANAAAPTPVLVDVLPGTYVEAASMSVGSNVHLHGAAGAEFTAVDLASSGNFSLGGGKISGLGISNKYGTAAIVCSSGKGVVEDNIITDVFYAVDVASACVLTGNEISEGNCGGGPLCPGNGVRVATLNHLTASRNSITGFGVGDIALANGGTATVNYNVIDRFYGTGFSGQYNVTSSGNPIPVP